MKKIKLLFIIFCGLLISSCDNNDDNDPNQNPELGGGWTLVKVTGGLIGINDEFPEGEITWTFNADGTVSIFNTNSDETEVDFFETGDYDFAIVPNTILPEACEHTLEIDGINFGYHSVENNILTLNQQESDGYVVTLHKIVFTTN